MIERVRAKERVRGGGNYFAASKSDMAFTPSGCKVLDLALGGGWAGGRIANIVGDKSTGKTLLCIEACANFIRKYPNGKIRYREAESAFDRAYAATLGMPIEHIDFGPNNKQLETIEDLFEDLEHIIKNAKGPELYILDSLDALSDRAELERNMDEGSYGTQKAKNLSQLFRRLVRRLSASQMTLIIVSQVRSKIAAMSFGRNTTRSGGRALDFYASQVLYLAHIGSITRTIKGTKRTVGIKIKAKCDKNKVALPFREAEFHIEFGYGIDDALACLYWLKDTGVKGYKGVADADLKEQAYEYTPDTIGDLHEIVEQHWYEIEQAFLPQRRKYAS